MADIYIYTSNYSQGVSLFSFFRGSIPLPPSIFSCFWSFSLVRRLSSDVHFPTICQQQYRRKMERRQKTKTKTKAGDVNRQTSQSENFVIRTRNQSI